MAAERVRRRLAAILSADVVGYGRLMGMDEAGTLASLKRLRNEVINPEIAKHGGRLVKLMGDGMLVEFSSVVLAAECAVAIQRCMAEHNADLPKDRRIDFRIGLNVGDIIIEGDDIYGDGVNVAARLEGLAGPGEIYISEAARSAVGTKLPFAYGFMGERRVKNIVEPVRVYRIIDAGHGPDPHLPPPCPYPGMLPFQPEDASRFYGRQAEVAQMVSLLRHRSFMMVIGPSGSGKSSLVQAGLLPALEESRYFEAGTWLLRRMRPGPTPNAALARAFDLEPGSGALDPDAVARLLAAEPRAERVLLLVDQFEETFTQTTRDEAARFIAALQGLRTRQDFALVLTLRADFYPDLMNSYLWPVEASERVEVAPLRGEALREAIVRPAADVGVHIEERLIERLLADAADEPGVLPLLQETMRLLWDEMENRTLTLAAYLRLSEDSLAYTGGVNTSGLAAAIATTADAVFRALTPPEQVIARRIFLRLVQFGEGRADTRRQQSLAALHAADDDPALFGRTLERLTRSRLLTRTRADQGDGNVVDIAHEALITGWARMRGWLEERREAEKMRRRLEAKAHEWIRLGRGAGGLLDEAELSEAERWLDGEDASDLGYDASLPALVEASQQAIRNAERDREAARQRALDQANALAEEQRQRSDEQARAAGRFRRLSIVLAGVFVLASAAAVVAWLQGRKAEMLAAAETAARADAEMRRQEAVQAGRLATAQLLLNRAEQQQALGLDELSVLLARQAYLLDHENEIAHLDGQVDQTLRRLLGKPHFAPRLTEAAYATAISRNGKTLAASTGAGTERGRLMVWDLEKHDEPPRTLPGPTGSHLYGLAFVTDGRSIIGGFDAGQVLLWQLEDDAAPPVTLGKIAAGVWSLAVSPDGRKVALGARDSDTAVIWDISDPGAVREAGRGPWQASASVPRGLEGGVPVAFSPDGETVASGGWHGVVRLWHPSDPGAQEVRVLKGHEGPVWAVAFSPDGKALASGGKDGALRIWNLDDPDAPPRVLRGHLEEVVSVAFGPDGQTVASASIDNSVRLWSLSDPDAPPVVRLSSADANHVAFSSDGTLLASTWVGKDGLRLWDLRPGAWPTVLGKHAGAVAALAFSPDGTRLASGGGDKVARLWDLRDPARPPVVVTGHDGMVTSVAFRPDDSTLATADKQNMVNLWRLGDRVTRTAKYPATEPWSAPISPDGRYLAFNLRRFDDHLDLQLVDLGRPDAEPVSLRTGMRRWISEIAFGPDGTKLLATGREGLIDLKDLTEPDADQTFSVEGTWIWTVAFSPDGSAFASGADDKAVRLWHLDGTSAPSEIVGRHGESVRRIRFSPDGGQLASASDDWTIRLWDMVNRDLPPAVMSGHESAVWTLAFSPDGTTLASGGADGKILLWDLEHPLMQLATPGLVDAVCDRVWRNLTLEEWRIFVGENIAYEQTCPNLPNPEGAGR